MFMQTGLWCEGSSIYKPPSCVHQMVPLFTFLEVGLKCSWRLEENELSDLKAAKRDH